MTIERSALASTVVLVDEVLFDGTGSGVSADTLALLSAVPACAGAVTVTVMAGALAPLASDGLVQVTETLPALTHVQPVPAADTNVTPAGRVSTTLSAVAAAGPAFATASE